MCDKHFSLWLVLKIDHRGRMVAGIGFFNLSELSASQAQLKLVIRSQLLKQDKKARACISQWPCIQLHMRQLCQCKQLVTSPNCVEQLGQCRVAGPAASRPVPGEREHHVGHSSSSSQSPAGLVAMVPDLDLATANSEGSAPGDQALTDEYWRSSLIFLQTVHLLRVLSDLALKWKTPKYYSQSFFSSKHLLASLYAIRRISVPIP